MIAAITVALVMPFTDGDALAADPAPPEMTEVWTRYGTGMVKDVATADVDGDGVGEIVVGGRGVGVIDEGSLEDGRYRWTSKWQDAEGVPLSSDRETVTEFLTEDLTGDGAADAIVGSDKALFAIDGNDGSTLWSAVDESSGTATGAWEIASSDFNGDGTPDVAFAELLDERISAVDGRDGSPMWNYPRPLGYVFDLAAGDLNGDGFSDVVVAGQVDAGIEIHAISGLAADATGIATPLWVQTFPVLPALEDAKPGSISIAQVEPGLAPEVIIGGNGALAVLDGLTGIPRSQSTFESKSVGNIHPLQLDADPQLEMVAVTFEPNPFTYRVEAFDSDTQPLWSFETPAPIGELALADLDGDDRSEIVAGGGWQKFGGVNELDGFVTALRPPAEPGGEPEVAWDVALPEDVDSLAVGSVMGQQTIVAGQRGALGGGSGLFALDLSGQTRWFFRTGGRVSDVLVADLDGDGRSEIVEGAEDSRLAVHDRDGALMWQTRVLGKGGPSVSTVAAGDLTAESGKEIAAGTSELDQEGPDGRLHLYSSSGHRLWSRDIGGTVGEVAIADVDKDGAAEVLVAAAAKGISNVNGVAGRYDAEGNVVWERPVPTGQRTSLSLTDLNADGVDDLVLTRSSVFHGGAVLAVDGTTGADLWKFDLPSSVNWASVTSDPEDGVTAGDLTGAVYRLASGTGETIWKVDPGSASWGGEWSADVNGDGVQDVLSASHEGKVRMIDGVLGEVLWAADTEGNPGYKVATLRGGAHPLVGVGELGQGTYSAANILLLDAVTGSRLGSMPTHGPVLDLAAGNLDDDPAEGFVAAAGWQVVALDVSGVAAGRLPSAIALEVTGRGSSMQLEARLTDRDSGAGIEGATIHFYADGTLIDQRATDDDGRASAAVPPRYRGARHEFEAVFEGDTNYLESSDRRQT